MGLTIEEKIMLHIANRPLMDVWKNHATKISKEMDIPISTATHILNRLKDKKILKDRVDGKYRFYDYETVGIQERFRNALGSLEKTYSMIL